jgi:small subunit ribosomal protein S2
LQRFFVILAAILILYPCLKSTLGALFWRVEGSFSGWQQSTLERRICVISDSVNFPTMKEMLAAGVHFGHQTRFWNPKMAPYIYGARNRVHIINLEKTKELFYEAMNYVARVGAHNGKILFVGTKHAARSHIQDHAVRCDMPYVDYRWLGGMLTNYKTVRQSVKRLMDLQTMQNDGTFEKLIKKEALLLAREMEKLERGIGGIKNMNSLPDALFVVDIGHEKIAVREAINLGIPVIGVADTNADPRGIQYLIPGNDDAQRAIELYVKTAADCLIAAREAHQEQNSSLLEEAAE